MPIGQTIDLAVRYGISNIVLPSEGPKVVPCRLVFNATGDIPIDGSQMTQMGHVSEIQGVYIDNAANAAPFSLTCEGTGQTITIGANKQGYFPILQTNPPKFIANTANAGPDELVIELYFYNVPIQAAIWDCV